jgi:hypothetical protein
VAFVTGVSPTVACEVPHAVTHFEPLCPLPAAASAKTNAPVSAAVGQSECRFVMRRMLRGLNAEISEFQDFSISGISEIAEMSNS